MPTDGRAGDDVTEKITPTPEQRAVAMVLFYDQAISAEMPVPEFRLFVDRVIDGLKATGWTFNG